MPVTIRRGPVKKPAREVLSSGPFKSVNATTDPFDDKPEELIDAVNMYIPDAEGGSGIYARPGTVLMNSANQLGGSNHMGQCVYHHTALDGTEYNFAAVSGKIYKVSADLLTYTDVTPSTVTIDGSVGTRVFMMSFADMLIVSDGVNRPWMGTNLSSTPITGTNIQYDSGNSLWSAQHMTEYSGALVFIVKTIAGVYHQTRITWSAPFDPAQGYFNAVDGGAVDYTWDLVQTDSTPLYGIQGTNIALIYWRAYSMGGLSGAIGPDFQNSSTHDAIDFKVGTRAPATIATFGNTIFFCDSEGRPQMLPLGNRLQPIWMRMRNIVETSRTDTPSTTALTAVGAIYASLNLYVVAIWSPLPSINLSPNVMYVFDSLTGKYVGRWSISPGINIETLGILKDANGQPELVVIGTKVVAVSNGFGGYVWRLCNTQENIWTDNGAVPTIQAQTSRLGYAADMVRWADKCVAITGSVAPVTITVLSAASLEQGFITDVLTTEVGDTLITESGNTFTAPFTRASTATYNNISGVLQTAGIDVVRNAHYALGVLQPALFEASAVNLIRRSEPTIAQLFFKSAGVTDATGAVFTPWGFLLNGNGIQFPATAVQEFAYPPITISAGVPYVLSVYVIMDDGSAPVYGTGSVGDFSLVIDNSAPPAANATVTQIAGTLYRVSASKTSVGVSNSNGVIRQATQSAKGFKVVGFQCEAAASLPTSYIPTSGVTGTRAADTDSLLSATATGYARVTGDFAAEGFLAGQPITPQGFASNPVSTMLTVTTTTITVTDARSVESAQAGRSLIGGTPGSTLMAEGIQQATATPSPLSLDGTYRCPFGLDIEGRGFIVLLSPTTAASQWRLHQVQLTSVESMASPEEA